MTSIWVYSLSSHSFHNFEIVTEAFLTQYASRREDKKNNHDILTDKIRQGNSLNSYMD